MRRGSVLMVLGLAAAVADMAAAQPATPKGDWQALRANCRQVLTVLHDYHVPLPTATQQRLQTLLQSQPRDPEARTAQIQKWLDPLCLVVVSINPESRVKAARGQAAAVLVKHQATVVLIKVNNEAGVTHALTIRGPQLRSAEHEGAGRWLEAGVLSHRAGNQKLSGRKIEYVAVRLTAAETGKREVTLKFDVGQGTQDLGFRAEVPVLFTVLPAPVTGDRPTSR